MTGEVRQAAREMHGGKKFLGWLGCLAILVGIGMGVLPMVSDADPNNTVTIMILLSGLLLVGAPVKDLIRAWRGGR